MARPSKPLSLVKSHRSNDEKKAREEAEKSFLTDTKIVEWDDVKWDIDAHKEFVRITSLLAKIGKNDDLNGHAINSHCLLHAECKHIQQMKAKFQEDYENFETTWKTEGLEYSEYIKAKIALQKAMMDCDKQLMAKRKMLLDIGKENCMTLQAILRSIPKKAEEEKESPLAAFLRQNAGK